MSRSAVRILRFPLTRIVLVFAIFVLAPPAALVVVGGPVSLVSRLLGAGLLSDNPLGRLFLAVVGAAGVLVAYRAFVRLVERRPVFELSRPGAGRGFGVGLLFALALVGGSLLVLWVLGVYRAGGANDAWAVVPIVLANAVTAGVTEEVLFRAGLFRIAEEGIGTWPALALVAAIFGLSHLLSENASLAAAVGIVLEAGVLLTAAFVLTRRLWLVIGFHLGFNLFQGLALQGVGDDLEPFLRGRLEGPAPLSGGGLFEASIVTIALGLGIGAYLLLRAAREGRVVGPSWWSKEPGFALTTEAPGEGPAS